MGSMLGNPRWLAGTAAGLTAAILSLWAMRGLPLGFAAFWLIALGLLVLDTAGSSNIRVEPPPIALGSGQAASGGHCSGRWGVRREGQSRCAALGRESVHSKNAAPDGADAVRG